MKPLNGMTVLYHRANIYQTIVNNNSYNDNSSNKHRKSLCNVKMVIITISVYLQICPFHVKWFLRVAWDEAAKRTSDTNDINNLPEFDDPPAKTD